MISVEITSTWSRVGLVAVSSVAMLVGIIAYVRMAGLRSFSKMSAFDFAVTVAMGSLLASVTLSGSSLVDGLTAAAALLGAQVVIALLRSRLGLGSLVDNEPLLLMVGPDMLEDNLRRARISPDDLRAKLREANVRTYDDVRYVVFETTGDVNVVHGKGPLDPDLLHGVVGADRLLGRR